MLASSFLNQLSLSGLAGVQLKPDAESEPRRRKARRRTAAGTGLAAARGESKTTPGPSAGPSADTSLVRGWHFFFFTFIYLFFENGRSEKPTSLETRCFGGERGNEMKSAQSLSPKSRAPFLKGGSETDSVRAEVCQWPQMNTLRRPPHCDPNACLSFHNWEALNQQLL